MEARNHALAVLENDFPEPLNELCQTLMEFRIADIELVYGGGGEAGSTQRLRRALTRLGWHKRKIVISKVVDGKERSAISHEIDHVRKDERGSVALEFDDRLVGRYVHRSNVLGLAAAPVLDVA